MANLSLLVALALAGQAGQPAQSAEVKVAGWTKYESVEGRYSVRMPGTPKERTRQAETADGKLDMHIAVLVTGKNAAYLVMHSESPVLIFESQIENLYDGGRDGAVATSGGGKLVSDKNIKFLDVPAREILIEVPADKFPGGRLIAVRYILRGTRFYQVMIVCPKTDFKQDEVAAYFDSLQVTDPPGAQSGQVGSAPQKFTSVEGRYSVQMPAKPRESTRKINIPGEGEVEAHLASGATGPNEACLVDYSDYPVRNADVSLKTIYDSARDAAIANVPGGKVVAEHTIKLEDLTGREVKIELVGGHFPDGGTVVARYFLKGSRLYQLMVVAPKASFNEKRAADFFDSFQITSADASK
jgi:hypothetical protein